MTLHITLCTPNFVMQVSDCLVTAGTAPFDATSNKNVLYNAPNGLVAIAYAGVAYLDGVPTDRFIAETLRGEQFKDVVPGQPWIMMGKAKSWPDVGQATLTLQNECRLAFERLTSAEKEKGLRLLLAGWQWPRHSSRQARPVVCDLGLEAEPNWLPRRWHLERPIGGGAPCSVSLMPAPPLQNELPRLLRHVEMFWPTPDNLLVPVRNAFRRIACVLPTVGANTLALLLPHPRFRFARVLYDPLPGEQLAIKARDQQIPFTPGYSPWLIGQMEAIPPSQIAGSWPQKLGPFEVTIAGPPPPPRPGLNLVSGIWQQHRPRYPTAKRSGASRGSVSQREVLGDGHPHPGPRPLR